MWGKTDGGDGGGDGRGGGDWRWWLLIAVIQESFIVRTDELLCYQITSYPLQKKKKYNKVLLSI